MKLYQVIRQIVPERTIFMNDDTSTVVRGFTQVVWEGTGLQTAMAQLEKARRIETPKGTVCVLHEYDFSA